MRNEDICILCGKKNDVNKGDGHNSEPIKSFEKGVCCTECNDTKVTPERMRRRLSGMPMKAWRDASIPVECREARKDGKRI